MSAQGPCGRCSLNPARGHAQIDGIWYCHGSATDGPSCYMLASWERSGVLDPKVGWERLLQELSLRRSDEVADRLELLEDTCSELRGDVEDLDDRLERARDDLAAALERIDDLEMRTGDL